MTDSRAQTKRQIAVARLAEQPHRISVAKCGTDEEVDDPVDVLDEIRLRPKPGDMADWWKSQSPRAMSGTLDEEELEYIEFFSSAAMDEPLRIRGGLAALSELGDEQKTQAQEWFGDTSNPIERYLNRENRRRMVAHYVLTHPATVQYELELYRLSRDSVLPLFMAERVYETATGKEALIGIDVSRSWAVAELMLVVVVGCALKKASAAGAAARQPTGRLDQPLYDLPPEGGMMINGRWYTEHALERMAPDIPQVRAEMRARVEQRLERLGIPRTSPAFDRCWTRAMQKVDPRGVPPSVVEAEIMRPGSTYVRVITAKRGSVVVTVIPKNQ